MRRSSATNVVREKHREQADTGSLGTRHVGEVRGPKTDPSHPDKTDASHPSITDPRHLNETDLS
jgi:hypothetical protein